MTAKTLLEDDSGAHRKVEVKKKGAKGTQISSLLRVCLLICLCLSRSPQLFDLALFSHRQSFFQRDSLRRFVLDRRNTRIEPTSFGSITFV